MLMLMTILQALLLVIGLSIDAFATSFGYGVNKIKMPYYSMMIIAVICSSVLGVSLFAGKAISAFLTPHLTLLICFVLLLTLGILRLFESLFKGYLKKRNLTFKEIHFKIFDLEFDLNLGVCPEVLDTTHDRVLNASEAAAIALACSLDGLAVGFGVGLTSVNPFLTIGLSLFSTIAAIVCGSYLGRVLSHKIDFNLSWITGVTLMTIAFLKVI